MTFAKIVESVGVNTFTSGWTSDLQGRLIKMGRSPDSDPLWPVHALQRTSADVCNRCRADSHINIEVISMEK
jgi:hypothetical protein